MAAEKWKLQSNYRDWTASAVAIRKRQYGSGETEAMDETVARRQWRDGNSGGKLRIHGYPCNQVPCNKLDESIDIL